MCLHCFGPLGSGFLSGANNLYCELQYIALYFNKYLNFCMVKNY
jgi:hypothetical protein